MLVDNSYLVYVIFCIFCFFVFFFLIAVIFFFFFFFQAEDGIRDGTVTGVQKCALPISSPLGLCERQPAGVSRRGRERNGHAAARTLRGLLLDWRGQRPVHQRGAGEDRGEGRRD